MSKSRLQTLHRNLQTQMKVILTTLESLHDAVAIVKADLAEVREALFDDWENLGSYRDTAAVNQPLRDKSGPTDYFTSREILDCQKWKN